MFKDLLGCIALGMAAGVLYGPISGFFITSIFGVSITWTGMVIFWFLAASIVSWLNIREYLTEQKFKRS